MNPNKPGTLSNRSAMLTGFRSSIIAGLFISVPILITIWVAWWSFSLTTDWAVDICRYINPEKMESAAWIALLRVLTFTLLVFFLFLVGALARITFGEKLLGLIHKLLLKLPILSIVYSTCEQISETVKSSRGGLFKEVALFEYPRKGCYAIGFVTNYNEEKFEVNETMGEPMLSIFMPTTPNPTSGFLIFVPKRECRILKMSSSEAMTLIVSGGAILPGTKKEETPSGQIPEGKAEGK